MDRNQHTKKGPCQTPAPLAGMKDEQKKFKTEADDHYTAPNTLLTGKLFVFFTDDGKSKQNKTTDYRKTKPFCGHFQLILKTKCNDGPVSKVCFPVLSKAILQI